MANNTVFIKKILFMSIGVLLMTALVTTAKADDSVTRTHRFDLKGVSEVEIRNGVGRVEIIPATGDEMSVILDIEANRHGHFFRPRRDVSGLDLESRERGDTLILEFEEHDVSADWVVEMPRVDRTDIDVGVGEVRLEIENTELDLRVGVGEVRVEAPVASVGKVRLNTGVGDASLRGGEVLDDRSSFISKHVRGEGEGDLSLDVEVGVGDISVRLD